MKKCLVLFFLVLVSCSSLKQHTCNCELDKKEFMSKVTTVLIKNNFTILASDADIGYLKAFRPADFSNPSCFWEIQIDSFKIIAKCYKGQPSYPLYCGDNTEKDYNEYWEVRNYIQRICNNKFTIVEM